MPAENPKHDLIELVPGRRRYLRWIVRLKLLQGEYPPTILMATSPTRFRVEGMGLSTFVDFQITDGRATALTVPWAPDERWKPK